MCEDDEGNIWISSPIMAVESDKRIGKLIYYPVFWQDFGELLQKSKEASFIFLDTCDLGCRPYDNGCEEYKTEMTAFFRQNFKQTYSVQGECQQFVFRK
jgi:hypothetical protein